MPVAAGDQRPTGTGRCATRRENGSRFPGCGPGGLVDITWGRSSSVPSSPAIPTNMTATLQDPATYLGRLGYRTPPPPTLETLQALQLRHTSAFAFETIDTLLRSE